MNNQTIESIVAEIATVIVGGSVGKVFQLSRLTIVIDLRTRDGRYLLISVDPQSHPRLYLISRRVRDLEKQSLPPGPFVLTLHKRLAGARLIAVEKVNSDRIVKLTFVQKDVAGQALQHTLIVQLTGRAANMLLLDERDYVIDSLRPLRGKGADGAVKYELPAPGPTRISNEPSFEQGSYSTLSAAADAYYQGLENERLFASLASNARSRLKKEITQRIKLRKHLQDDLASHGDADTHKRIGELLIANLGTAERQGDTVTVTDYYSEGMPQVELSVDENTSLQDEAASRFTRYSKARRAADEIARRIDEIDKELGALLIRQEELERIIVEHDQPALESFFLDAKTRPRKPRSKKDASGSMSGTRRYLSSDGFEILVGRAAKDNDHLTFKIARPYDLWLHAADYPGSHVIVLNPTRKEIPYRTVVEAAELAAKFSQARRDGKVDVHYTQRKFLAKPKGAAPGLVRMSSFRTIIVEPGATAERI